MCDVKDRVEGIMLGLAADDRNGGPIRMAVRLAESPPLAMMSGLNAQQLTGYAAREAKLTHCHPLSGDVVAAVVVICHELVRGSAWKDAIESARAGRLPETRTAMTNPEPNSVNRGGFAPYFVGSSDTFDQALDASLQFAGPANYCPVLAGSLGDRMLNHCDIRPRVRSAATSLASL